MNKALRVSEGGLGWRASGAAWIHRGRDRNCRAVGRRNQVSHGSSPQDLQRTSTAESRYPAPVRQTVFISSSRSGGGCGCLVQLFLLFTLIPLAELWLLLFLSRRVGLLPTLGLVVFTGALGAWLARTQGLRAFAAVQAELNSGRMPTTSLLDGLMILVAGAVLLTPGLLTDVFGFLLLIPWTRSALRKALAAELRRRFVSGDAAGPGGSGFAGQYEVRYRDEGYRTESSRSRPVRDDDEQVILVDEAGQADEEASEDDDRATP